MISKFKKLAVVSAVSVMFASGAFAQTQDNSTTTNNTYTGAVTATGDITGAVTATGDITGAVSSSGAVTVNGDITASGTISGAITATGSISGAITATGAITQTISNIQNVFAAGSRGFAIEPNVDIADVTTALTGVFSASNSNPVDITVFSGAINTAFINGAIEITGTNVNLGGTLPSVTAIATAVNSEAFAIAGAKLGTTVIGAMNSSTVEIMGKSTELGSTATTSLGFATFNNNGGVGLSLPGAGSTGTTALGPLDAKVASMPNVFGSSTNPYSVTGFDSTSMNELTSKTTELQAMNVFNGAINVATLDAGIRIAANVDNTSWFLNPQTGIVNLSNVAMTTTAIGAMNSSFTRLGTNLPK